MIKLRPMLKEYATDSTIEQLIVLIDEAIEKSRTTVC